MTTEDFDAYAMLPENADRILQFINGEVVEVASRPYASWFSSRFARYIGEFVDAHDLGYLTGEGGGYKVGKERYVPSIAYISKARQPQLAYEGYNPNPPDLAIEVDFPSTYQSQEQLRVKIANYLAAGTIVWLARPDSKTVEVYIPGKPVKILGIEDTLDGGDVLPGFTVVIKDVFP